MFDKNSLYEACNYLLSELKDETLNLKKGKTFKSLLAAGELVDGWYVVNTKTEERIAGPSVRAYMAFDAAKDSGLEPSILDVVKIKDSKFMVSKDFANQPFSENLPAGWYIVNKLSKVISRGPINQMQAKLHSKGDEAPFEAHGKVK